jgi:paired amphipathic helix protein Sin3a
MLAREAGTINTGEDEIECVGKAEGDQIVDANDEGEESAPKSSDDSDNPSPMEDMSGSESANADDCEGHDNDDNDEHELKNESEGEVEGMADADPEGEGTSLVSSEKLLVSCMPLSIHAPSIISGSTANCSSTVFYGNDTLYVLFRLHQVICKLNECIIFFLFLSCYYAITTMSCL